MFGGGIGVFLYQLAGVDGIRDGGTLVLEPGAGCAEAARRIGAAHVHIATASAPVTFDWSLRASEGGSLAFRATVSVPSGIGGPAPLLRVPLEAETQWEVRLGNVTLRVGETRQRWLPLGVRWARASAAGVELSLLQRFRVHVALDLVALAPRRTV